MAGWKGTETALTIHACGNGEFAPETATFICTLGLHHLGCLYIRFVFHSRLECAFITLWLVSNHAGIATVNNSG